jgi:DNA-binding response OmpR family regulator
MNKILIIEDDASIANLQKDYLEINQMDVTIENDGQLGLETALTNSFDLIIVDVMLPNLDGFEICKKIRANTQIPIMIVSAKKEDFDKVRGLGLGANDYLVKPFSPNELVARVKAHISRYQSLQPQKANHSIIETPDLRIDKAAHKVWALEQEVFLTHKEFNLLVFLAEHPNRVWRKEELFETLWGFDSLDTEMATVVVHIKRIREKLKKANLANSPIETIWGSGYRFNL